MQDEWMRWILPVLKGKCFSGILTTYTIGQCSIANHNPDIDIDMDLLTWMQETHQWAKALCTVIMSNCGTMASTLMGNLI